MPFIATEFPGLMIFEPVVFKDSRGYFFESYNQRVCKEAGITTRLIQDNQSASCYGVIRGLHYQLPPYAQAKFIRVLSGKIYDVVVDIRVGSPTYKKIFAIEISAENRLQLYVPAGFAHGFSVLSENAEVLYKCDRFYNKKSEAGIRYNDPELNIDWKIPPGKEIISEKDRTLPLFSACRNTFEFSA